jgi:hypothetical protein
MSIFVSPLVNLSIIHNLNFSPTTFSEISDCVFTSTFLHAQSILTSNFHAAERNQYEALSLYGFFFQYPVFNRTFLHHILSDDVRHI